MSNYKYFCIISFCELKKILPTDSSELKNYGEHQLCSNTRMERRVLENEEISRTLNKKKCK